LDDALAKRQIDHRTLQFYRRSIHRLHTDVAPFEAVALHVFHQPKIPFRTDRYQSETRAHDAGDVQAGFAQTEHGDVHALARLAYAGVADIADQKRVVAFALRLHRVEHQFAYVVVFEKTVMHADA